MRRLFKQVQLSAEKRHGQIDYYFTRFLTGHGCFRSYLKNDRTSESQECLYCPGATGDINPGTVSGFTVETIWVKRVDLNNSNTEEARIQISQNL